MNKRNPNYTKAETETLVSLVADYIDVIECKKSDAVNIRRKEDSWKFIEKKFNMESSVYRNYKELRKKYENLKAHWKRKAPAETAFFTSGNSGVPTKQFKSNEDDMNIALNLNEMVDIKNEIDNDECSDTYCENKHLDDEKHAAQLEEFLFSDTEAHDIWHKHSEVNSKTPQCEQIDNSDRAKSSTGSNSKLFKIQERWSEEEKLKLETDILREQHQEFLKNNILQRQFMVEKQEMARERHKIEMDILRLELEKKKIELI